jgi:hypothetical protein
MAPVAVPVRSALPLPVSSPTPVAVPSGISPLPIPRPTASSAMPIPLPSTLGSPRPLPLPTASPIFLARPSTKVFLGITVPKDDPWLAGGASLALTGAGQLYNEEWWQASLFLASNLLYLGGYAGDLITGQQVFRWTALGLMAAIKGLSVWEAMAASQAQRSKVVSASDGSARPVVAVQWQF